MPARLESLGAQIQDTMKPHENSYNSGQKASRSVNLPHDWNLQEGPVGITKAQEMPRKASWCIVMHHNAPRCIIMHHDASWCIMMHHDSSWFIMSFREFSRFSAKIGRPHENSVEHRQTSANIDFPKIDQDHSGSVPGLQKPRKTLETHKFGPTKKWELGAVPDDRAPLN